jgi:hypothetical protein
MNGTGGSPTGVSTRKRWPSDDALKFPVVVGDRNKVLGVSALTPTGAV